jgi:hypothetical protein
MYTLSLHDALPILAEKMQIKENTACEYLGKLVKIGKACKVSRGVYGEHV